ncbi:MAG: FAD-dependent monooxygenase, partial [Pseudomonadota bacterium]
LEIASKRALWPIISQAALQLTARRLVLVAEAAHVMPPIGAQGLNTSLHDVEQLARIIEGAADPGAPALLSRYQARVLPRTLTRIAGVDVLNRAALARAQPLRDLRVAGLRAISRITPIRNLAVRMGLGV